MVHDLAGNVIVRILLPVVVIAVMLANAPRRAQAAPASAGDEALFKRLDADANGKLAAAEVPEENRRLFARLLRNGDRDGDSVLSQEEFLAALVPSRPEKPIEEKQPATFPQANAVRYLLIILDTNRDAEIEAREVPTDMQRIFDDLAERLDDNDNDVLERYELGRSFRELGQTAARYVARERINVEAELKKLEKSQGKAVNRFDEPPRPIFETLRDPEQARKTFDRLDGNDDGELELDEVPEPLRPQIERFMRLADRDRSGGLSEREFLAGTERMSRFMGRGRPEMSPGDDAKPDRKSRRKKADAATN
jgi:hypothetical protein